MRKFLLSTAAVLAAVVVFLLLTLPPAPSRTPGFAGVGLDARTIAGAYHVHTLRSDGTADVATVARAAARAGLHFVVFTDHGDGTRIPDAPVYRDGVLCIDGVEVSTNGGHYVALGMRPAPYPLGGEPAAVVEDVARLGGFGIVAHPDSGRPELGWSSWDLPFGGVEWLSADSEWRDESRARLARVLFDYLVRPPAALASVLDRPVHTLARWDALTSSRHVVGLAALDAHGGMRGRMESVPGPRLGIRGVPSYEASFRSFAIRAIVAAPLSGNAAGDANLVLEAIRRGHVFTAIDAIAAPAFLDFHAGEDSQRVEMGESTRDDRAPFFVDASVPRGATVVLLRNGFEHVRAPGGSLRALAVGPGSYRVEVQTPGAPGSPPVPWLVSNPIYVDLPASTPAAPPASASVLDLNGCPWHVEKDEQSDGSIAAVHDGAVRLTYRLKGGAVSSQFVALACDLPATVPAFDAIRLRLRTSSPARVSVQLRFAHDGDRRWIHSVYSDSNPRDVSVAVSALVAAERGSAPRPDVTRATSVLVVIDLTNALPGSAGAVDVANLGLNTTVK